MVRLTESAVYLRTKASVQDVKKLNLWGCEIEDISICARMTNLEVLSLSVNKVTTLEPLKECQKLKELYLRKNNIEDLKELEHLKSLPNLRVLWIDENPCTAIGEYKWKVLKILPQLTKLDDKIITKNDYLDPEDESVPECEMQASFYSTKSSRSSAHTVQNELMTRSLYAGKEAIVDTVMQPQMASFFEASDEEPQVLGFGAVREDDWGDFSLEEEARACSMDALSSRMCMSLYDERPRAALPRSASAPRRRITLRQQSTSPHRQQRLSKILSAVSVLMDELDPDGLRDVIDEAQKRIKKQR